MTSSIPTLVEIIRAQLGPAKGGVPASWHQGRTVFGGFSAAISLAHAMTQAPLDGAALRGGQVSFIGPVSGQLSLKSEVLREGRSITSIGTDLFSNGELGVRSVFFFGAERKSTVQHDGSPRPPAQSWEKYPLLFDRSNAPAFLHNFDIRPAGGAEPFSSSDTPEIIWWVKHLHADGLDPLIALVAMGDALPPAAATGLNRPAPLSSVSWFFDIATVPRGEWFLLRSFSEQAAFGYSIQQMDLWDESGVRVMTGRQTVAVFA
ncbi:thioesterase family protein [Pseudomonas chlororaphis]|uniref:thioesterase family protein n=1 Tax=Pseudomonas chlororaphis TaxID=587753 RepID=UPI001B300B1C|nr:thioesterase family protein [Pseudomonas chlororaphis]MBP5057166.1 thioesterase family protein [Pseudomonas chlororaphis]MBP5143172.1 thioesterase family protein [Pseudomonas chlororaphis]QTU03134.1 thioesterase family protein [Pseudomonas chlororaphis]